MRNCTLLLLVFLMACAEKAPDDQITIRGAAFGTTYDVLYFGQESEAQAVKKGIDSVVYMVNNSMSTYIEDSDISKINKGDTSVVVDDMFVEVFMLSRKLNKATSGYFDPTVGVLRNAYGFGDTDALKVIDTPTLDSLMQFVGWKKVSLKKNRTLEKENKSIYFDFNAVAKGYGVDRVATFMKKKGYTNFLVNIGGEIVASGKHQGKNALWTVGIESEDSEISNRTWSALVNLSNKAMASSGNYRKNRMDPVSGKEYVHTINPLTGSAEKSDVLSATIIADDCATADAWATACMAMGLERSKVALKTQDVEAYLVYDGGVFMTKDFKEYLVE